MKKIDVRGQKCPMPLIETKKALREAGKDEAISILTDNESSVSNIIHYLKDNNIQVEKREAKNHVELIINENPDVLIVEDVAAYCADADTGNDNFIIVFGKDQLGEGSDELGSLLVGSMLTTLVETGQVPEKIIFINSGINLVTEGSLVLQLLQELENRGAVLLSCGSCLDYFGKTDDLKLGRICSMPEILEYLTATTKVINI